LRLILVTEVGFGLVVRCAGPEGLLYDWLEARSVGEG
jgi:hypothetical protein